MPARSLASHPVASLRFPDWLHLDGSTWPVPPLLPPRPSLPALVKQTVVRVGKTAESTHDRLEQGLLQQTIRLDSFFGNPMSQKEQNASYVMRWRNSLRFEQGGIIQPGTSLNAQLDLTRLNDRFNLMISGESAAQPLAPRLPEDPGNPGFDRTFPNARVVNTEVRYYFVRSQETTVFWGAGFNLTWPPQPFARLRYQDSYRIDDLTRLRWGETFFVKTRLGPGETTELSLERSLNPKTMLVWAQSATVSQEVGAVEWGNELSLLRELSSKSAVTLTGGIYGNTSVDDWITNYKILLRYRRNFLRSWLFYEIEPEIFWPRRGDGRFPPNWALTLNLEVVFQGKEKQVKR